MNTLIVLALALGGAQGQGMGNGISKNTYTVWNAGAAYEWISEYIPFGCFDGMCDESDTCAQLGRGQLCTDTSDCTSVKGRTWMDRFGKYASDKVLREVNATAAIDASLSLARRNLLQGPPPGGSGGMGIHAINTTARPFLVDDLTIQQLEAHFTDKIGDHSKYDSFMDYTLVLYTPDLDTYMSKFDDAGEAYLPLEWTGESGDTYYSIIKQVPDSQIVLELVSDSKPSTSATWTEDSLVRVPDAAFSDNSCSSTSSGLVTPVVVSKATSNMTAIEDYYTNILQGTNSLTSTSGLVTLKTFKLSGAAVQIRFVERPATDTSGLFKVADWEEAKLKAFAAYSNGLICGFSKWYDNHFAWDQNDISMNDFADGWDKEGWQYHIWNDPNNNVYAVDPTGDSIQMDASWSSCTGDCADAEGNALSDACMMGNCKASSTSSCVSKVKDLCDNSDTSTCMDCVMFNWDTITADGCTIADAGYHCTGY